MGLGPRLDLRQTQSLVMTPQLQQAIKLLALSNLEVETFIGDAVAANPLLEVGGEAPEPAGAMDGSPDLDLRSTSLESSRVDQLIGEGRAADDRPLDLDPAAAVVDRDTGDGAMLDAAWGGELRIGGGEEGPGIDERGGHGETLIEHLEAQLGLVAPDARIEAIARYLIGLLDDAGYLPVPLREVCDDLGIALAEVEAALAVVQCLEPTGVGARGLSECIALQAREADRYDPCMARLIDNLDLVARGEFARLRKMCAVDDEDFADMLAELRGYDPKPGLQFGGESGGAVTPDILIEPSGEGWKIALNETTLPRLVVNRSYYVELRGSCGDKASRGWLSEKLADANWLIKALDQRQKTILKVASELVKQQEGFFRHGVSHLKPLTLRTVAEAIGMHESTVSRVTSAKYLLCSRGTFELKYFFTSGISTAGGEGASAEAVKSAIRKLIDAESPKAILSDDSLVDLLKAQGFDLARRTVAKYREAIGLGSSVQRRRQKAIAAIR
ncbi:RNA polymerase factor sigma-54 [uncultured Novosphingobium sp.]|uniref:RNA polymerase factor sigma-54 n=1 Tax=uncultured Novosphingobium sp. TaxID=292277 RepID=UPI00258E1E81|nr:RNA polymerase factor sigma-54 [uncultured Novosphingobium sp.]